MSDTVTAANSKKQWVWRIVVGVGLWLLADIAALMLWRWQPPFIGSTGNRMHQIFELYSFTHVPVLVGIGVIFYPLCRRDTNLFYPLTAFLLLAFFYLTLFEMKFSVPSYDYRAWCNGMVSQLEHGNPYCKADERPSYWYPPLMAQSMAITHRGIEALFPDAGARGRARIGFYFFQCVQFALLIGTFWLTYTFVRRQGLGHRFAAMATFCLLLLNVPLYRMFAFQQINLWMVNAILLVLLFFDRSSVITGLAIAVGFHTKLYPAILGLPLLVTRRWRPLLWTAFFTVLIAFIETDLGRNPDVWLKFLDAIQHPHWGSYFRDNSMHSIAKNLLKPFLSGQALEDGAVRLMQAFQFVVVGWIGSRMVRRELKLKTHVSMNESDALWISSFRFMEHAMDTIAMSFVLSPIVFEHHYVMAIPLALWTFIIWGNEAPRRILVGSFLIFLVPIYDVVPFSWNRIAGLLILMLSRPVAIKTACPSWPPRLFRREETAPLQP